MRSYGQYCSVAKALDVLGDRWTLLIVRELALRGTCRYKDLQSGLPGISTNLLAERLRELEQAEVIVKRPPRPPIATPVFELTEHGRELEPILRGLMSWGARYMVEGPAPSDAFLGRWLTWPADTFLIDREPHAEGVNVAFEADGEAVQVTAQDGVITVRPVEDSHLDASVAGTPHTILGLIAGYLDLPRALELGVSYEGSREAVERLLPEHPPSGRAHTAAGPQHAAPSQHA